MNRRDLARNLARSIASADWSTRTVEATLSRRLPPDLRTSARAIAAAIVTDLPGRYAPPPSRVAERLMTLSAFERLWLSCMRRDLWPDPDLSEPEMAPIDAFARLDLPVLTTVTALADWLVVPPDRLDYLADPHHRAERHDDMAVNHYHYHLHRKPSGGTRLVEAPKPGLKSAQRRILDGILGLLPPHTHSFGFVKGRTCLMGAERHVGEDVVLRFDLKHFFPTIRAGRVFGLFRCLGYPHEVARLLSTLCSTATPPRVLARLDPADRALFRTPHLPQGAPTSPALANQMCHGLDRRLAGLAARLDAQYSRYADDMSFSGDAPIAAPLLKAVPQIVAEEGFQLNPAKTKIMRHGARKTVTALVVNDHLNVDRDTFDHLKAIIHACGEPDDMRFQDPAFRASLLGRIGWVETVNPARGAKLRRLLARSWERRFSD